MTSAVEYLAERKKKFPPHGPAGTGADRAQQLYAELAPSLPAALRHIVATDTVCVGEIGDNQPLVETVRNGSVIEFYSGMMEFLYAVVRTLAGMNIRVEPRHGPANKPALSSTSVAKDVARLLHQWRWPNRWLWAIRRIEASPFELSDPHENWAREVTKASERFLLAHELGHVVIAHGLAESLFANQEMSADAIAGCTLIRFSKDYGDDLARSFGGSVLALRVFAALQSVGVPFSGEYPKQVDRMKSYWSFIRSRMSSWQYFHEVSRIAVAYLEQMDDVVAILDGRAIADSPDTERFLVTLIGMLLEVSRNAVPKEEMVEYIVRRFDHTPTAVVRQTLQALYCYYVDAPAGDAFFDSWTIARMGQSLRAVVKVLPSAISSLL